MLLFLAAVLCLGVLPSQLMRAQDVPFTASPKDVGLEYENVSIQVPDEDLQLSAWWMPAEAATAVVLFIHGANSNKEDTYFGGLDYYAEWVARRYHVLAVDLRNHGGSSRTNSGRLAYGREEHRDVSAAITRIAELAPGLPVIGSGVSMGGAALIEAAARDERLTALVLIDPLLEPQSATLGGMVAVTGLPACLLRPTLWSATTLFGLDPGGATLLDTAGALDLPVLLIQDPGDPVTRAEFASELARANPRVTLELVPSAAADHPVIVESGPWGSHAGAFRLDPQGTMQRIERFVATQ